MDPVPETDETDFSVQCGQAPWVAYDLVIFQWTIKYQDVLVYLDGMFITGKTDQDHRKIQPNKISLDVALSHSHEMFFYATCGRMHGRLETFAKELPSHQ